MAGLLIGMLIYGTDQFVSTDACAPVIGYFVPRRGRAA
jgi:hypothetical protein